MNPASQAEDAGNGQGRITSKGKDKSLTGTQIDDDEFKGLSQFTESVSSLTRPQLGKMEFIVPLTMTSQLRDYYEQTVFNFKESIEAFAGASKPIERGLSTQMHDLLEKLENFSVHQDLEDPRVVRESSASPGKTSKTESQWAEESSAKFRFLGQLLATSRAEEVHVAILARPGASLNFLERFLRGYKFAFTRPDRHTFLESPVTGAMQITLLPTGPLGAGFVLRPATVVVAMDKSVDVDDEQVVALRRHVLHVGQLAPVLRLVVANSVEHVERCIPTGLDETLRRQTLVSCIAHARHEVGRLPPGCPDAVEAAEAVAEWLSADDEAAPWPLPLLGEVAGVDQLWDRQPSLSSRLSSVQHAEEQPSSLEEVQMAPKRILV